MAALPPTLLVLPLAAAAALLREPRARSLAAAGAVAYLLSLAALRLDGWVASPLLEPPVAQAATPWLVATAGLVVAAALASIAAAHASATGGRDPGHHRALAPATALLVAAGLLPAWPVLAAAGPGRALAAGVGLAAVGVILAGLGHAIRLRSLLARVVGRPGLPWHPVGFRSVAPWAAAFLLVAFGPHLHLALAGVAMLLGLTASADWRARSARAMVADGVALVALAGAWWLLGTVAGDGGGWMRDVTSLPLSPAAEYVLAPLLGVVLFRLAGAAPLGGPTGALLAWAAALLGWRLVLPALPGALPAWSAGVLAAGAVGAALAGAARRPDLLLAAAGTSALLAGGDAGRLGGTLLLVAAPIAGAGLGARARGLPPVPRVGAALFLAWAAGEALTGTLAAEVVYSVVLLAGAAACAAPARG